MNLYKNLTRRYFLIFLLIITSTENYAQHTFSICSVDPVTGQVGSAGATCIASSSVSAIIISDVHPGVGVVHTQASWISANQNYGTSLMSQGLTPQQIIDSLISNDMGGDSSIRQYGVVTLTGGGSSAGFTGANCFTYHNDQQGPTYSIQGNILLGQHILDSMQSKFLNTPGDLACKLMAAMQGAKVIGADTRCTQYNLSSYSSFIRVANTSDVAGSLFLDISVNTYPGNVDPIDSMQQLFSQWGGCFPANASVWPQTDKLKIYPNPATDELTIEMHKPYFDKLSRPLPDNNKIEITNSLGEKVFQLKQTKSTFQINTKSLVSGVYFIKIIMDDGSYQVSKFVKE